MSSRSQAVVRVLVGLYPAAWRARYAEELLGLIEETGTGPRVVLDLVLGLATELTR